MPSFTSSGKRSKVKLVDSRMRFLTLHMSTLAPWLSIKTCGEHPFRQRWFAAILIGPTASSKSMGNQRVQSLACWRTLGHQISLLNNGGAWWRTYYVMWVYIYGCNIMVHTWSACRTQMMMSSSSFRLLSLTSIPFGLTYIIELAAWVRASTWGTPFSCNWQ